jgi:hypothetical protein
MEFGTTGSRLIRVLFAIAIFGIVMDVLAAGAFRCTDQNGRPLFTDNARLCHDRAPSAAVETVKIKDANSHSQYGETISEEFFNYPFRAYQSISGKRINIVAEDVLAQSSPALLTQAADKLEQAATRAIASFPQHLQKNFANVKFFIFTGDEINSGGRDSGQWYFRKGNNVSERLDDSIVIRSAREYVYAYPLEYAYQTEVHELSHAHYYYYRSLLYADVKKAFQNAVNNRLYTNVASSNGTSIAKAYALTNDKEYFAEICTTFLAGNHYYPFDRESLRTYDPMGYALVVKAMNLPSR